ncbi:MAG: hypothetical protein IT380_16375 [Myxococcales bacterium]|nr:hypothetical protein [Myxococcales bacterium]
MTAVDAAAQYCPSNPPPDEKDRRPKKRDRDNTCSRSTKGDPVVVTGNDAYTFDRLEDFFIPTAQGGLTFYRTYYSSDAPWMQVGGAEQEVENVPTPFGKSPVDPQSLRWTHNLFSFVDKRWSNITVRPPVGTYEKFGTDCGTPGCWVPRNTDSPGPPARLRRTANGFEYFQDDGKRYVYEAAATGSLLFFLSAIVAPSGDTIATVEYAPPSGLGCLPMLSPAGVPYISAVSLNGGPRLEFSYVKLTRESGGVQECVLSAVAAVDGASSVNLTSYAYVQSGGASRPGRLASVQTPEYFEEFEYTAGFRVKQNGNVVVAHTGTAVTSAQDFLGDYSFSTLQSPSNNCGGQWKVGYCCSNSVARSRTVTTNSGGKGDGTASAVAFQQAFNYVSGEYATRHTAQPVSRVDSCAPSPDSCSAGEVVWLWDSASQSGKAPGDTGTNCIAGYPGYVSGTHDDAGRMTGDAALSFTWDAFSSLVAVKTSGTLTEALQYDGLGPAPSSSRRRW